MTRQEKLNLLEELLKIEEKNDIGNLTRAERAEFQEWVRIRSNAYDYDELSEVKE
jgi:hypothetical protein